MSLTFIVFHIFFRFPTFSLSSWPRVRHTGYRIVANIRVISVDWRPQETLKASICVVMTIYTPYDVFPGDNTFEAKWWLDFFFQLIAFNKLYPERKPLVRMCILLMMVMCYQLVSSLLLIGDTIGKGYHLKKKNTRSSSVFACMTQFHNPKNIYFFGFSV